MERAWGGGGEALRRDGRDVGLVEHLLPNHLLDDILPRKGRQGKVDAARAPDEVGAVATAGAQNPCRTPC